MKPPAPMDYDADQALEPTHATSALSTHAEASKMLEAALQQIDGIIGTQHETRKSTPLETCTTPLTVREAIDQLISAVEATGTDKKEVYYLVCRFLKTCLPTFVNNPPVEMEMDYNKARLAANDTDFVVNELDRQWHNSPVFSTTQPVHQTLGSYQYIQSADPWLNSYRPNYPSYRSHSLERLNQPFYVAKSPVPSPVHTPCGSPVIGRRSSPALNPSRPRRPVPPLPPLPPPSSKAPYGKPPLPSRQRPVLMKSKTLDYADEVLLPSHRARPLDVNSKIPSLDSLYEQLKALSGSSTPPLLPPGPQPIIDTQLAADLTAAALEMVANSPLARRRSSTFSGSGTPYAQYARPKVVFITRATCKFGSIAVSHLRAARPSLLLLSELFA